MAEKRDYYEVLGISKGADESEIKSAYRKKAKQLHPDVNRDDPNAEDKFKEVQEAYSVLSDESKRKMYDQYGHAGVSGSGPSSGGYGGFQGFEGGFDFGDIFESFFGGAGGFSDFSSYGSSKRTGPRATRGSDILMRMDLTWDEAIYGCTKKFNIDVVEDCEKCHGDGGFDKETCSTCKGRGSISQQQQTILGAFVSTTTCPDCHGTGQTYKKKCSECNGRGKVKLNKKLTITIQGGINTGDRQKVTGKGNPGSNGGPNGDLYIEFEVDEHDYFIREIDDIYLEVPLTLPEAILGCKKEIPTLYGNVKLNVSPGTNSGDKERIKGKGVDNKNSKRKGDMYVIFKIYTPKHLSREQKKLIEQLEKTDMATDEIKRFNKYTKDND